MPKYRVNVCRIAYGNLDIEVEAKNEKEAMSKAEDKAGNYEFTEHTSEYKAQGAMLVDPPTPRTRIEHVLRQVVRTS